MMNRNKLAVLMCLIMSAMASQLISEGSLTFPDIDLSSKNYLEEACSPLNDVWGFESNESSYAVVGASNGVAIVDVTSPRNPVVSSFPYFGCVTEWRDIKTYGDYIYVVNDYTTFCDCSEDQQPCQQVLVIDYQSNGNQLNNTFYAAEGHAQKPLSDFPNGVNGVLVYPSSDVLGCSPLTEDLTGKIALIDRGDCTFTEKTLNAQAANAIGIVIVDSSQELIYPSMSGNNTGINIPGLLVGSEDGQTIKMLLNEGIEVTAELNSANRVHSDLYKGPDGLYILDKTDPTNVTVALQTREFFDFAHNILVDPLDRPFVYVCGQTTNNVDDENIGGIMIFDISNPIQPELIAEFNTTYIHDIEVVDRGEGLIVLYGCAIYDGDLYVINVSDPRNTPNLNNQVISVTETIASPHNTAQTEDGSYLYITHEEFSFPVTIWDSSDLTNLVQVSNFSVNAEEGTSPHNAMVKGYELWMSYYSEGVLVYDITNPITPALLGQKDTSTYTSGFHGVWGIFPYTNTDNVAYASDIETGLWILNLVGNQTITPSPSPSSVNVQVSVSVSPSVSFNSTIGTATNATSPGNTEGGNDTFMWVGIGLGVTVAIIVIVLIALVAAYFIYKKRVASQTTSSKTDFDRVDDGDDLF